MPVNSSQWCFETENFYNSFSNDRCDRIFHLKNSLLIFTHMFYYCGRLFWRNFLSALFFYSLRKKFISSIFTWDLFLTVLYIYIFISNIWFCKFLVQVSGDIGLSPEPKPKFCKSFTVCYCNLNSISSHNFTKVSLLTDCNGVHKFNIKDFAIFTREHLS